MSKKYFRIVGIITLFVGISLLTSCEPDPNDPNNPDPTDSTNFALTSFTMNPVATGGDVAANINQIITADDNSFIMSTIDGDIYRSIDNGASWNLVLSTSGVVSMGDNMVVASDGKIYAAIRGAGLYLSTNNGSSFSMLSATGLPSPIDHYGVTMVISPTDELFVFLYYGSGSDYILKSTNGGLNFTSLPLPPSGDLTAGVTGSCIQFSPNGSLFIIGNNGLYRSDDNGNSWNLKWSSATDLSYVYVSPSGTVLFNSSVYLYNSSDNGESFVQHSYSVSKVVDELPNGNLIGIKGSSDKNEFVYRSTDEGDTWLSMGTQDIAPYFLASNNTSIVTGSTNRLLRLDLNETFWRCKKLPTYPAWKDFDVSGNDIVIAANQQLYYSDNLGQDWRIGLFVPWNVFSLDLNNDLHRLAVGCGSPSGVVPDGWYYILDAQAGAIIQENHIGISGNINDIVMADDNSLAFAVADPVFTSGSVFLVDNYNNGNGTYVQYSTGSSDNLPYRLFYDKYAEKMYITWQGGGFGTSGAKRTYYNPAGNNSYFLYPDISYTDWIPVENGYNPGSVPFNFTRSERPDKLFFVIHGPNTLWYQDATHLWKSTTIDLPEQIMQMGFDGNGYFWALINGGLYKSDAVPAIIDL